MLTKAHHRASLTGDANANAKTQRHKGAEKNRGRRSEQPFSFPLRASAPLRFLRPGAPATRKTAKRTHRAALGVLLASFASWRFAFRRPTQKLQNKAKCHSVPPAQTCPILPEPATNRGMQNKPTDPHSRFKIEDFPAAAKNKPSKPTPRRGRGNIGWNRRADVYNPPALHGGCAR